VWAGGFREFPETVTGVPGRIWSSSTLRAYLHEWTRPARDPPPVCDESGPEATANRQRPLGLEYGFPKGVAKRSGKGTSWPQKRARSKGVNIPSVVHGNNNSATETAPAALHGIGPVRLASATSDA